MRLWHQDLITKLSREHLLSQHRECCALRGGGWGRPHSTVNYVFQYNPFNLVIYHYVVMTEMKMRGFGVNTDWYHPRFRGDKTSLGIKGIYIVL